MTDVVHTTARRRRKDGSFVDVEFVGIPVSVRQERVGAVALYEDITERKQMEAWLRLANAALEAAANAIIICDREGYIIWVNPAFTRLTGYAPEEAIGQTMRLLKSGQHDQAFYQNLWETILAGQMWQGETTNRRKDGSLYVEAQTIAPVRDQHGAITHFISIKQDLAPKC
jgi:sigma-B regulation protein RsbU (phosphoserine phosphatase)